MRTLAVVLLLVGLRLHGWAQSTLDLKIATAEKALVADRPEEGHPVSVAATLAEAGDSLGVIVKVELTPGWHIYDYVPSNLPYIPIDTVLKLPANVRGIGGWQKSVSMASANDPGVLIYEGEAVFVHKAVRLRGGAAGGTIQTGLYYQTCNMRQCLPPVEKTIDLTF